MSKSFKKGKKFHLEKVINIFSLETSFNGVLKFSKPLQISGEFIGEIESDVGYLYIKYGAKVKANIKASTVVIGGEVIGNVYAFEKIQILSSGKIHGNIKTKKLEVEDGVVFEGNCEMIPNN